MVQIGCYRGYVVPNYLERWSPFCDFSAIREDWADVGEVLLSQITPCTSGVGQVWGQQAIEEMIWGWTAHEWQGPWGWLVLSSPSLGSNHLCWLSWYRHWLLCAALACHISSKANKEGPVLLISTDWGHWHRAMGVSSEPVHLSGDHIY